MLIDDITIVELQCQACKAKETLNCSRIVTTAIDFIYVREARYPKVAAMIS